MRTSKHSMTLVFLVSLNTLCALFIIFMYICTFGNPAVVLYHSNKRLIDRMLRVQENLDVVTSQDPADRTYSAP